MSVAIFRGAPDFIAGAIAGMSVLLFDTSTDVGFSHGVDEMDIIGAIYGKRETSQPTTSRPYRSRRNVFVRQ